MGDVDKEVLAVKRILLKAIKRAEYEQVESTMKSTPRDVLAQALALTDVRGWTLLHEVCRGSRKGKIVAVEGHGSKMQSQTRLGDQSVDHSVDASSSTSSTKLTKESDSDTVNGVVDSPASIANNSKTCGDAGIPSHLVDYSRKEKSSIRSIESPKSIQGIMRQAENGIAQPHGNESKHATDCLICELLLHNGASINALTKELSTPLMVTAYNGQVELAKVLLRYQADVSLRDHNGMTATEIATQRGRSQLASLLVQVENTLDMRNKRVKSET